MADEYIRREDAKIGLSKTFGRLNADIANYVIDKVEPADVVQVVHGRWIKNDNGTWSCGRCHSWIPDEQHYYARFCLYCGAKMDGKE